MADNIVSVHLSERTKERLERLSGIVHRPAASLAAEALESYLNDQEWQIGAVDEAVALAENGAFVSHDAMSAWLKSWGTEEEISAPASDTTKARR